MVWLAAAFGAAAEPQPPSAAAAALDAWKAAGGGAAWLQAGGLHTVSRLSGGGGAAGSSEGWTNLRTGHYTGATRLAGSGGTSGFDGVHVWNADETGLSRIEDDPSVKAFAVNQAYRERHGVWRPGREGAAIALVAHPPADAAGDDVVTIIPRGGRPFELWINRTTHLPDRMVENRGFYVETERYEDYRQVAGLTLPFRVIDSKGEAKFDVVAEVERAEVSAQTPPMSRFEPPPPPAPDYAFPAGADRVELPIELLNNHVYVQARVNGSAPQRMLFDTGATAVLDPQVAERLGVRAEGAFMAGGAGAKVETEARARIARLDLGGLIIKDQSFAIRSQKAWREVEGADAEGTLGYELARRFVVVIDYPRRRMILIRPSAFTPPAAAKPVPFKFLAQLVEIDVTLDGHKGVFVIDTGSRASLLLLDSFIQSAGLAETRAHAPEGLMGWGVGGGVRGRVSRAGVLAFGDVKIDRPTTILLPPGGGPPVDGNIGGGLLRRFRVTFDYAHQRVWFEPDAKAAQAPDPFDRSGLWLNREGEALVVKDVLAGSAGDVAGLKVGDAITAVDGAPAGQLVLSDLRAAMRDPARGSLKLTLGAREVVLTLRDIAPPP